MATDSFDTRMGFEVTETGTMEDRYSEGIELANACRNFYHKRQKMAEEVKSTLATGSSTTPKKTTNLDKAMDTLRREMASLMDLDLSLMKQLLTMNEAIEELKFQQDYMHRHSTDSLNSSQWSVSETDMYSSDDDEDLKPEHTSDTCQNICDTPREVDTRGMDREIDVFPVKDIDSPESILKSYNLFSRDTCAEEDVSLRFDSANCRPS